MLSIIIPITLIIISAIIVSNYKHSGLIYDISMITSVFSTIYLIVELIKYIISLF